MSRVMLMLSAILVAGCAERAEPQPEILALQGPCDAAVAVCKAASGDKVLQLALLSPKPMQPFETRVTWHGPTAEAVVVNFEMVGMDMGENRYHLAADGSGEWRGKAVLPICVLGRSDWVADVQVTDASGASYRARVPFMVNR